jgi:hypothetical protein
MPKTQSRLLALALFAPLTLSAQFPGFQPPVGDRLDSDQALSRALKASSLTDHGKPFHAVMEIGTAGSPYSGRIELWWVSADKYRLQVTSPQFSQTKVVNGSQVQETNQGGYYPRWLENFVLALMDPIPIASNFVGRGGSVMVGPRIQSCIRRDDHHR